MNYFNKVIERINDYNLEIIVSGFSSTIIYEFGNLKINNCHDYGISEYTYSVLYKNVPIPLNDIELNKIGQIVKDLFDKQELKRRNDILSEL